MTPTLCVAVVDAKTPGNVGTIARAMKNFGLSDLLLIDPPPLGPDTEAYGFAGRAREDVLAGATELSFDELVNEYHTVGFTSTPNATDTKGIRHPVLTPPELAENLSGTTGRTALVFGRERTGLTNDELAQLDAVATIPANPEYPVLNLGQAVTIALYACRELTLGDTQLPDNRDERASAAEIEALYDHVEEFLDLMEYPSERREKAVVMLRRLFGRAHPTSREVATVHGIMRSAEYRLEAREQAEQD